MTAAHIKTSLTLLDILGVWGFVNTCTSYMYIIINDRLNLEIKNSYHLLCVMDNEKFTQYTE